MRTKGLLWALLLLMGHGALSKMVSRCPEGWVHQSSSGQCFRIHSYGKLRKFSDARSYCKGHGGDLAIIEDVDTKNWLSLAVAETGLVGDNAFMWVGAKLVDGQWKWVENDDPVNSAVIEWEDEGASGDCAAFTINSKLTKYDCVNRLHFICHRPINVPPPCNFETGWEQLRNLCYLKSSEPEPWHNGRLQCRLEGGDLITITSSVDQQYATDFALEQHDNIWIGLSEEDHPGKWTWSDGSDNNYTHWDKDQPESMDGFGAAVINHEQTDGKWVVEKLTEDYHYLCQKKQGACVAGWEEFGNSCYYFNTEEDDMVVWDDAKTTCEAVGARLVVLDTLAEDEYFRAHMPETDQLWIGLYSNPGDGFYWVDESSMQDKNFTFVSDENIEDAINSDVKKCSFFQIKESDSRTTLHSSWIPTDCATKNHYACEIPAGDSLTLLPPPELKYCPEGWVNNLEHCYLFSFEEKSWASAQSECQNGGGDLVSILTWGEQDYVSNNMMGNGWIGLNDRQTEDVWVWSDNSKVSITNWNDGEPNGNAGNENCGEMRADTGKWNDLPCHLARVFTCKRKASATPIAPVEPTTTPYPDYSGCGWDWTENPVSGECYRLELIELSFEDARHHCMELYHSEGQSRPELLSLTTAQEQSFIEEMIREQHLSQTTLFIGLLNDVDGERWIDGTPMIFFNWNDGEPSGGYEECGEMYVDSGKWNDVLCSERRAFVCEKKGTNYVGPVEPPPPEVRCPNGWKYWDNHCYYFGLESKSWSDSRSWCQANLGSDLASITSEDENTYINSVLANQYVNAWIGLHDNDAGEEWHWMDGANFGYTNWMDGEPNNQDGLEHCGEIRSSDYYYSGMWNDMPCDLLNAFVCKTTVKTCPESWTLYNGKCYYASNFEATWNVARDLCKEFNTEADLVSIHSQDESDFFGDVLTHSSLGTWIGFTYDAETGQWAWSDGQPVNYTNWNDGEPNNLDGEACTEIIDAVGWDTHTKWNNMPCTDSRAFGCEFFPTHTVGCEEGWQAFNNYCYWYSNGDYSYISNSFNEARDDCRSKGGDLVSIHSQEENEFVYSLVGEDYYYTSAWIGLSDEGHSSELTWVDNTPVTFTNYKQFGYDPIMYDPSCGVYDLYQYESAVWDISSCSDYNYYICKKPQEARPINPPSKDCRDCPRDPNTKAKKQVARKYTLDTHNKLEESNVKERKPQELNAKERKLQELNAKERKLQELNAKERKLQELNAKERKLQELNAKERKLQELNAKERKAEERNDMNSEGKAEERNDVNSERKAKKLIRKTRASIPLDASETWPLDSSGGGRTKRPSWMRPRDSNAPFTSTNFHSRFRQQHWAKHTMPADQHGQGDNWRARIRGLLARTTAKPVIKEISGGHVGLPTSTAVSFTLSSKDGDDGDEGDDVQKEDEGDGDGHGDGTEAPGEVAEGGGKGEEGGKEEEEKGGGDVAEEAEGRGGTEEGDGGKEEKGGGEEEGEGEEEEGGDRATTEEPTTVPPASHSTTSPKPTETTTTSKTPTSPTSPTFPTSTTPTTPDVTLTPVPSSPAPANTTDNTTDNTTEEPEAQTTPETAPNGCKRNDVAYKGSCYMFPGLTHSWQDAKGVCEASDSHLVALNDRFESAFLSSYLSELGERAWIGMSGAIAEDGSVTFDWVTGEPVTFTNWAEYEPAPNHGTCVAASGRLETPGLWEIRECTDNFQYVCEYDREGYIPPTPPTTPAPTTYCADGWERHAGKCYKVFPEPRTWGMAEGMCNSYGAFLTSIGSAEEQVFLQSLPGIVGISGDYLSIWVGLFLSSDAVYYWTDGSAVDYVDWAPDQPDSHLGREGCVLVDKVTFKMSDSVCDTFQPFICEAAEGTMVTTQAPPTQTPDVPCDDDSSWLLFNDHCYKFISEADETPQTWWTSHRRCRDEGGELASIHSYEENYWIMSKIYNKSDQTLWIGGRAKLDSGYEWLDGSVFDFVNWAQGEPNNFLDQEDCISMYTRTTGYWNDQNCAHNEGRICKRPHHATLPPAQTTAVPEGHCQSGWLHVGSKCFKFFSERLSFDNARNACQALGSDVDMISVHSAIEQAHLTTALGQTQVNTWLGMRNERGFHWVDQTAITYTNWAPGEPNGHYYGEDCVEAYKNDGNWNDVSCDNQNGYVCMQRQDPSIGTHSPPPTCAPPLDNYLNYSGSCYKIVSTPTSWQDAEDACVSEGAHLASVQHVSEQSFLWVFAVDSSTQDMWIGLNNLKDKEQFRWSDDWPTIYTNWAKNEPNSSYTDHNCVRLSATQEGSWFSELCSEKKPYVCKHKDGPVPTPDPPATGTCPDGRWLNLGGGYCYLVVESAKPWNEANMRCVQENADLTSIHSQQEMDLITMATHKFRDPLWIGLVQKTNGYGWSDGTGFDYVNWQDGEPNSESEQCAEFYPGSGNWNDAECSNTRAFICKILKIQDNQHTEPTLNPPPQQSTWKPGPNSLNAGGIVGIVIAVLFVVAGVGFVGVTYMRRKPKPVSNNGAYSFDNALYSESYDGAGTVTVGGSSATSVNLENPTFDTDA